VATALRQKCRNFNVFVSILSPLPVPEGDIWSQQPFFGESGDGATAGIPEFQRFCKQPVATSGAGGRYFEPEALFPRKWRRRDGRNGGIAKSLA